MLAALLKTPTRPIIHPVIVIVTRSSRISLDLQRLSEFRRGTVTQHQRRLLLLRTASSSMLLHVPRGLLARSQRSSHDAHAIPWSRARSDRPVTDWQYQAHIAFTVGARFAASTRSPLSLSYLRRELESDTGLTARRPAHPRTIAPIPSFPAVTRHASSGCLAVDHRAGAFEAEAPIARSYSSPLFPAACSWSLSCAISVRRIIPGAMDGSPSESNASVPLSPYSPSISTPLARFTNTACPIV
ncbi:hypothetical protein C8Q80DRAFT_428780 [Daedaleopsis nitida]|nr:hypothetical protein C8Q80DRAFT_428780 [Daedaleopsis nitida]